MPETLSKPTLPTFSWIGHLKQDDRELLSSYGEFFPGHPGNVIIYEGAMQTEVFVVISGELEVRAKQEDGTDVLLARVGPGETLGEISLFNPGPAAATVTATEFSQLWRIADADLIHFMEENPGAGNVLLRTLASILAQRLRQMNPRAFGLSTYAIVDSLDLSNPPPELETTEESTPEAEAPASEVPIPLPPALAEPVSAEPASAEPVPSESAPVAATPEAEPVKTSGASAPEIVPVETPLEVPADYKGKKLSTKTQIVPDLDELDSRQGL